MLQISARWLPLCVPFLLAATTAHAKPEAVTTAKQQEEAGQEFAAVLRSFDEVYQRFIATEPCADCPKKRHTYCHLLGEIAAQAHAVVDVYQKKVVPSFLTDKHYDSLKRVRDTVYTISKIGAYKFALGPEHYKHRKLLSPLRHLWGVLSTLEEALKIEEGRQFGTFFTPQVARGQAVAAASNALVGANFVLCCCSFAFGCLFGTGIWGLPPTLLIGSAGTIAYGMLGLKVARRNYAHQRILQQLLDSATQAPSPSGEPIAPSVEGATATPPLESPHLFNAFKRWLLSARAMGVSLVS